MSKKNIKNKNNSENSEEQEKNEIEETFEIDDIVSSLLKIKIQITMKLMNLCKMINSKRIYKVK